MHRIAPSKYLSLLIVFMGICFPFFNPSTYGTEFTSEEIIRYLKIASIGLGTSFATSEELHWFESMEERFLNINIEDELGVPLNSSAEKLEQAAEQQWEGAGKTTEAGERITRALLISTNPNLRARWDRLRAKAHWDEDRETEVTNRAGEMKTALKLDGSDEQEVGNRLRELVKKTVRKETKDYNPMTFNPHANPVSPEARALALLLRNELHGKKFRELLAKFPALSMDIEEQLSQIRESSHGTISQSLKQTRKDLLDIARLGPEDRTIPELARLLIHEAQYTDDAVLYDDQPKALRERLSLVMGELEKQHGKSAEVYERVIAELYRRRPGEHGFYLLGRIAEASPDSALVKPILTLLTREGPQSADHGQRVARAIVQRMQGKSSSTGKNPSKEEKSLPTAQQSKTTPPPVTTYTSCDRALDIAIGIGAATAWTVAAYEIYQSYLSHQANPGQKDRNTPSPTPQTSP